MTVEFGSDLTDMDSAFFAINYHHICIKGSTKNVTKFGYLFYVCANGCTMTDDSDPFDLTSATGLTNFIGYRYSRAFIRFKPNTRSYSYNGNEGIDPLWGGTQPTWGVVSYANSLVYADGATKYCSCSGFNSLLTTILGTVEQRTDDTGTYDFFVEDANGTVTITDFITNIKGWTIV